MGRDDESDKQQPHEHPPLEAADPTRQQQQDDLVPLVQLELDGVTYAPVSNTHQSRTRKSKTTTTTTTLAATTTTTTTTVLDQVSTTIHPFQLTAWMGPSGSGKSSLVRVAAGLAPIHGGSIRINGESVVHVENATNTRRSSSGSSTYNKHTTAAIPKNLVGVVWQDDLLLSNLTVEESILFCARLKTPRHQWESVVQAQVDQVMEELGLMHVRHALIGHGISGGERKRVAVAAELVTSPSLLLLDEPTSSLDATTALSLIRTLQRLAQNHGLAIAVVIHQPRTEIFHLIDHLLLLQKGRTVYNGTTNQVRTYLEQQPNTTPLPPETGIADWIMDCILHDVQGTLADHWELHQESNTAVANGTALDDAENMPDKHLLQDTTTFNTQKAEDSPDPPALQQSQQHSSRRRRMSSLKELHARPKFETTFVTQVQLLTKRTTQQMRGEKLTLLACCLTLAYIVFSSLFWWRLPDTTERIYERASLLFFMLIAQSNGIVTTSIHVFQRERALLARERSKGLYGVLPFFLAKTVSDMTNNVLLPCVYAGITYWCANLRNDAGSFLRFLLIFYLIMNTAQSMGLFLSIVIPSIDLALLLAPPLTLFFMILGGFYIPLGHLHPGVAWMSWMSFARYGYSAMLVNEFAGRDIPCGDDLDGVYDDEVAATECPTPGSGVVESWGIHGIAANYWFGVLVMVAMQLAFRVLSYAMLRRTN